MTSKRLALFGLAALALLTVSTGVGRAQYPYGGVIVTPGISLGYQNYNYYRPAAYGPQYGPSYGYGNYYAQPSFANYGYNYGYAPSLYTPAVANYGYNSYFNYPRFSTYSYATPFGVYQNYNTSGVYGYSNTRSSFVPYASPFLYRR